MNPEQAFQNVLTIINDRTNGLRPTVGDAAVLIQSLEVIGKTLFMGGQVDAGPPDLKMAKPDSEG